MRTGEDDGRCLLSAPGTGNYFRRRVGHWLGTAAVQRLVSPEVWDRLGFALSWIPGFPKDLRTSSS